MRKFDFFLATKFAVFRAFLLKRNEYRRYARFFSRNNTIFLLRVVIKNFHDKIKIFLKRISNTLRRFKFS